MNMHKLQNEVWKIAEEKGWHALDELLFGEFIALCHSELSEALEIYREKGHVAISQVEIAQCIKPDPSGEPNQYVSDPAPHGIPVELADCVMRILDFCESHGIDLQKAIESKMNYNKTRSYRHGGKVI